MDEIFDSLDEVPGKQSCPGVGRPKKAERAEIGSEPKSRLSSSFRHLYRASGDRRAAKASAKRPVRSASAASVRDVQVAPLSKVPSLKPFKGLKGLKGVTSHGTLRASGASGASTAGHPRAAEAEEAEAAKDGRAVQLEEVREERSKTGCHLHRAPSDSGSAVACCSLHLFCCLLSGRTCVDLVAMYASRIM